MQIFQRTVTPQADLSQFVEEQLASFFLFSLVSRIVVLEHFTKTSGQLENGSGRAGESIAFLSLLQISVFIQMGTEQDLRRRRHSLSRIWMC